METEDLREKLEEELAGHLAWVKELREEIAQVIVGQTSLVDRLLAGLLANGHVLLEGVPGLAKTLTIRTLAEALGADFKRIQFTPDLLPADILGTMIYNPRDATFQTRRGPVFANLVLADEINRAPAKVQSALLEAMQEKQVTLGDETFRLPSPFLVLATENPIDQEGTYPLPEAQVDRFMFKVKVGYPSLEEERMILDRMGKASGAGGGAKAVASLQQVVESRPLLDRIHFDDRLKDYVIRLVGATRDPEAFGLDLAPLLQFGASPRATLSLSLAARAQAFLQGRAYVIPSDIREIALDVLRHRVIPSYEAEAEGLNSEDLVNRVLDKVTLP